jgi:hypothetical protein
VIWALRVLVVLVLAGEHGRAKRARAQPAAAVLDELVAYVVKRHPYEIPNVTALPIVGGNPDYLALDCPLPAVDAGYGLVWRALVLWPAFVGTRPAEAYGLVRADLDVADAEVDIRRQRTPFTLRDAAPDELPLPKNGKTRRIVIPPPALDAVQALPRPIDPSAPLFATRRGRPLSGQVQHHYWHPIRCAFGNPSLDLYELRHFCASYMLNDLDLHAEDVAAQLGRTDGGRARPAALRAPVDGAGPQARARGASAADRPSAALGQGAGRSLSIVAGECRYRVTAPRCCVVSAGRCGWRIDWRAITVQHVGIEIRAVGPHDGSQLGVDRDLAELVGVSKRLEDRAPQLGLQVDVAGGTIAEADAQRVVVQWFDVSDSYSCRHGSGSMLASGTRARAACQLASSSAWWSCAHSCTRRSARLGRSPESTERFSITIVASYSPYNAWK